MFITPNIFLVVRVDSINTVPLHYLEPEPKQKLFLDFYTLLKL